MGSAVLLAIGHRILCSTCTKTTAIVDGYMYTAKILFNHVNLDQKLQYVALFFFLKAVNYINYN